MFFFLWCTHVFFLCTWCSLFGSLIYLLLFCYIKKSLSTSLLADLGLHLKSLNMLLRLVNFLSHSVIVVLNISSL